MVCRLSAPKEPGPSHAAICQLDSVVGALVRIPRAGFDIRHTTCALASAARSETLVSAGPQEASYGPPAAPPDFFLRCSSLLARDCAVSRSHNGHAAPFLCCARSPHVAILSSYTSDIYCRLAQRPELDCYRGVDFICSIAFSSGAQPPFGTVRAFSYSVCSADTFFGSSSAT